MEAITVHHLENSRSLRILWLLEELELPYTIRRYPRDPKTMRAPAELRQLHALGKAPIVTIGDVVLAESGAILEHFADATGKLRPEPGTAAHREYRYWMHAAEGSFMAPLLVKLITGKLRDAPVPFFIKPIARAMGEKVDETFTDPELKRNFAFIDEHLSRNPYFAGQEFSMADIQMSYPVEAGGERSGVGPLPSCKAWLGRVTARPAYLRAVEKGGANSGLSA